MGILVLVLIFTYFFSGLSGRLYLKIFPFESAGSFIDGTVLIGLPLAYIFFLTLLFTLFGGQKKYWWIGIGLIPAVAFEIAFDFAHIYFPVVVGFIGWLIGWLIIKAYLTMTKRKK